jgi:hypothetical protein
LSLFFRIHLTFCRSLWIPPPSPPQFHGNLPRPQEALAISFAQQRECELNLQYTAAETQLDAQTELRRNERALRNRAIARVQELEWRHFEALSAALKSEVCGRIRRSWFGVCFDDRLCICVRIVAEIWLLAFGNRTSLGPACRFFPLARTFSTADCIISFLSSRLSLPQFDRLWSERFAAQRRRALSQVAVVQLRHREQQSECAARLQAKLHIPKFSAGLLDQRKRQFLLAKTRRFAEAEAIRVAADALEAKEMLVMRARAQIENENKVATLVEKQVSLATGFLDLLSELRASKYVCTVYLF